MPKPQVQGRVWVQFEQSVLARALGDEMDALVVKAPVTARALRLISTPKLDYVDWQALFNYARDGHAPGLVDPATLPIPFPVWIQNDEPTDSDLSLQADRLTPSSFIEYAGRWIDVPDPNEPNPKEAIDTIVWQALVAGPRSDRDTYYSNLGKVLVGLAACVRSPNQRVLEVLGSRLNENTLKQHILRARSLGYMPIPIRAGQDDDRSEES